jgi:hypothetical protein
MASTKRELDALTASRRVSRRAGLLAQAKGAGWAGWTSPRWVFLQVLGALALGAIAESHLLLPKVSTGMLLASLVVSHVMSLGQRIDALVALVESDAVRGCDEP